MENEVIYEVVKHLIGNIEPVGETNEDNKRFQNLKELGELVEALLIDIDAVAAYKNRAEHSLKRSGEYADKLLDRYGIKQSGESMSKCEHCGTETIDKCYRCGAPVCCPRCCDDTELQEKKKGGEYEAK